jgi:hypothetical protein
VSSPDGLNKEYMRVILGQNAFYRAIRNYYPEYLVGTYQQTWPAGSIVTICQEGVYPEPSMYDPDWSYTKFSVLRFLELMGYPAQSVLDNPGFIPQPYGLRKFVNESLPPPRPQGYANYSTAWPVEFNEPSLVAANTHTWEFAGYYDYSRGLPKFQTNLFPRKLQYDYYGSVLWGGRISVAGVVTNGEIVFLGPVKETQTGNYYLNENPELNFSNRTFYQSPEPVKYPNQILIFNCDDFSDQFNGVQNIFPLTVAGIDVPPSRLLTKSVFVTLGGVQQLPSEAYTIGNSDIVFSEPPESGTTVAVKVVTSDDEEESMTVVPLSLYTPPNGATRLFELVVPPGYIGLDFTQSNVFVSIGGIQQIGGPNPLASYNIDFVNNAQRIFFVEPPEANVNIDIRAFVTGPIVRSQGQTINVVSLDDISYLFDGTTTAFELRQDGILVNPNLVTEESTIVQLGGVIQEPPTATNLVGAYTIDGSVITFSQPPPAGATADIRVILSNSNLIIACPNPPVPYSND